jgi:hypothetical protein
MHRDDVAGSAPMRRLWWPEPLYEARPYGALTLGLLAGSVPAVNWVAEGNWNLPLVLAFILGCAFMAYGVVIVRVRYAYRRRSRWQRERKH